MKYFGISMTCVAVICYGWLLLEEWLSPKREKEEITLPDGRRVQVNVSSSVDFDYPWNRGKHWFFRSPYRGMSPFVFILVILAVLTRYGWAMVGVIWVFVVIMGGIGVILTLLEKN